MMTATSFICRVAGRTQSSLPTSVRVRRIDRFLKDAGALDYLTTNRLIACYHERGSDELANRAIKDFGHEQLPFKRFAPNAAWYYTMLVGHFLLESFKEDVGAPVVAIGSYASTVRRRLIDIAGKIVSHSGKTILKVSQSCLERLRFTRVVPALPGCAGYRIIGTEISQSKRKPMYRCVRKPLYFVYKHIKTDY